MAGRKVRAQCSHQRLSLPQCCYVSARCMQLSHASLIPHNDAYLDFMTVSTVVTMPRSLDFPDVKGEGSHHSQSVSVIDSNVCAQL